MSNHIGDNRKFSDIDEITALLTGINGKTFREIDKTGRGEKAGNKGSLGNIIEESVFGYSINSDKQPDIMVADEFYELKVTPIRSNKKKKIVAKERLVVDIINYLTLCNEVFDNSSFWQKARQMIIIYYLDNRTDKANQSRLDCTIYGSFVLKYEPGELETIRKDWEYIKNKVAAGHADALSESDTNYLAACTKGESAEKSLRDAPAPSGFESKYIRAKQRAFSYKPSYMTIVAQRVLGEGSLFERLPMSINENLNDYVQKKIGRYVGYKISDLANKFNVELKTHYSFNSQLALKMLGVKKNRIEEIEQFAAASVTQLKTTVLYDDGKPEQNMSFPALKEDDWAELADPNMQWHDSRLYKFFENNKFYFVVFKSNGKNRKSTCYKDDVLVGGFLWNMPEEDIEKYVAPAWNKVHEIMISGKSTGYGTDGNQLPKMSFNHVFHMRPHGKNGNDVITLPNGETITKQCWWLDRLYIAKIVAENISQILQELSLKVIR